MTTSDGAALRGAEFAYPAVVPAGADAAGRDPARRGTTIAAAGAAHRRGPADVLRPARLVAISRGRRWRRSIMFWRAQLASAAARAPRRLELTLTPGDCRRRDARSPARRGTGDRSRHVGRPASSLPAIAARVVDERGAQQDVRLWPTAELGVFEGDVPARPAGRYRRTRRHRRRCGRGYASDRQRPPARRLSRVGDPELAATLAGATGGVAVTAEQPSAAYRSTPRPAT